MRRGARWTLVVGAALAAMAGGGSRAEVRPINLAACSGNCFSPAIDDPAAAEDNEAVNLALFLCSGDRTDDANDPGFALIFDQAAMPTVLVNGLPSPLTSADLQAQGALGPSPYDFFEDVILLPAHARTGFAAASFFLFSPSLVGRLTFTDVLSNSAAVFRHPPLHPAM